jgi:hypothetical protein
MKKVLVVFILLMLVVPAMATITVTATCSGTASPYTVTVSYATTGETLPPRAFGLLISCDANGTIGTVANKASYYVAPGSFNYDGTQVTTWGNPIVPVVAGKSFILEVGSLYASNDPCTTHRTPPALSGTLLTFPLTIPTGKSTVSIAVDAARGGVVREDPTVTGNVTLTGSICGLSDCMKNPTVPASWRTDWVAWGKPSCWCYSRHCRGDFDGKKAGVLWVQTTDFNGLKSAINKTDAALALVPNGICADFDHLKVGVLRVQTNDFNIFKAYVNKIESLVPICPMTNFNFWTVPAP